MIQNNVSSHRGTLRSCLKNLVMPSKRSNYVYDENFLWLIVEFPWNFSVSEIFLKRFTFLLHRILLRKCFLEQCLKRSQFV